MVLDLHALAVIHTGCMQSSAPRLFTRSLYDHVCKLARSEGVCGIRLYADEHNTRARSTVCSCACCGARTVQRALVKLFIEHPLHDLYGLSCLQHT